jgi:imidazolonepropionase-like amidohydrolase
LGLESDFGSIEKDKMASFLILSENPLYDLGALRSMEGIVLKGYYYNRATMDSWMKSNVSED